MISKRYGLKETTFMECLSPPLLNEPQGGFTTHSIKRMTLPCVYQSFQSFVIHTVCFKAFMWSRLTAPLISQHATRLHLCLQQVQLFRETKWIMVVFQQHLEVNCMWVQCSFFWVDCFSVESLQAFIYQTCFTSSPATFSLFGRITIKPI